MRKGQKQKNKKQNLNGFKFSTFSGRFPSEDAASMAVKGLKGKKKKKRDLPRKFHMFQNQNQNQNIYCPSIGLQGNLSYGAQ